MKLHDWVQHGGIPIHSSISDDVLASIIAFRGASPQHEAKMQCFQGLSAIVSIQADGILTHIEPSCRSDNFLSDRSKER
jgi:hypothetical protein